MSDTAKNGDDLAKGVKSDESITDLTGSQYKQSEAAIKPDHYLSDSLYVNEMKKQEKKFDDLYKKEAKAAAESKILAQNLHHVMQQMSTFSTELNLLRSADHTPAQRKTDEKAAEEISDAMENGNLHSTNAATNGGA